jgi:hypothetical protein
VTGAGYVFTQQDKQLFTQAVVQFCAKDLHNNDVVSGEGFKNLIETVLFIGRRSHGDTQVFSSFDPVRNLIPDAQQLREVYLITKKNFLTHNTNINIIFFSRYSLLEKALFETQLLTT